MRSPQTNDQWLGTSPVDECLIRATLWEPQRTEAAGLAALPTHRRCRRCSRTYFLRCRHHLSRHFPLLLLHRLLAPLVFRSAGGGECEVGGEWSPLPQPLASLLLSFPPSLPVLPSPQYVPASRRDVSLGERVS